MLNNADCKQLSSRSIISKRATATSCLDCRHYLQQQQDI